MNCKPGDLAIIVWSAAGNEGKIVRCVRLLGERLWYGPGEASMPYPTWEVDRDLHDWGGEVGRDVPDAQLRPIRDPGDDAVDETLEWLPSPSRREPA